MMQGNFFQELLDLVFGHNFGYKYYIIIISITAFISGAFFFAMYNKNIIFNFPSYKTEVAAHIEQIKPKKKKICLCYWRHNKWNKEAVELLWSDDKSQNIKYLINSWLNLLDEESIMKDRVALQTALLSSSGGQVYLSFDRNPLSRQLSVHEKLLWIEGLLQTLRESGIDLQSIYFLVHHEIMQDYHLDFSNPWPIYGFLDM